VLGVPDLRDDALTKGVPVLKVPVIERSPMFDNYGPGALLESETRLYDLAADPAQASPLVAPNIEKAMASLMRDLMTRRRKPSRASGSLDTKRCLSIAVQGVAWKESLIWLAAGPFELAHRVRQLAINAAYASSEASVLQAPAGDVRYRT
jgi:hypothetical protein